MRRTKILLIIEGTYPWYRGGVSEWVHQYLTHLNNIDFTIIQIATDQYLNASLSQALYEMPDNVHSLIRIPPPSISRDWRLETNRWLANISSKIESAFTNCDIVHLTNTGFAGWLGMKKGLLHDKPIVLTEHALYWKEVQMGEVALESGVKIPDSPTLKSTFIEMLSAMARQIYQAVDQIISVSACNIQLQEMMGAKTVKYIPNGISREWMLTSEKEYGNTLRIGWIGRCARMKNPLKFFELIDAFKTNAAVNTSFLMLSCDAGESDLEQILKKKAGKYPQLKLIWNRSATQFIDRMDALCITSLNESQPLVLFEAISRKVLPVGWQTGDATDKYGLFVPQNTPASDLVEQITAKWQKQDQWKAVTNQKHEFVARNHLWDQIFEKYCRIFDAIAREKVYAS